MLTTVIVLCLIAVTFWRSLLRLLAATILVLVVLGIVQLVHIFYL